MEESGTESSERIPQTPDFKSQTTEPPIVRQIKYSPAKKPNNQKNFQKEIKKQENKKVKQGKGMVKGKKEESFTMYSKGYKTVPCDFFLKGNCHKGDDCKFRHDVEQKPLDVICKFFLAGSCHKEGCLYLHDRTQYPCKYLHIAGKCEKMSECSFSHARFSSKTQIEDFIKQNLESLRAHRDRGIRSTILSYAVECGFVKATAEAEREQSTLIPPGLYDDRSEKSDSDESKKCNKGGQIDEAILENKSLIPKIPQVAESQSSNRFLFMP